MAKDKTLMARRLASISSAAPVEINANTVTRKQRPERAPRESVFRPAKIYTSKHASVQCVVCNISSTGVYARMEGAFTLPPIVIIRFQQTGVAKKARVVWQNEGEVGLAYISDLTKRAPARASSKACR